MPIYFEEEIQKVETVINGCIYSRHINVNFMLFMGMYKGYY